MRWHADWLAATSRPLLRDLDRSCIDGTPWQGEALARALPSLDVGVRADPANTGSLPGLYAPPEA